MNPCLLSVCAVARSPATKNRVTPPSHLRDDIASGSMEDWTCLGTLPGEDDFVFMRRMFVVLMGRITSKRMKWMQDYKMQRDCVVDEVEHEYQEQMRRASQEVHILLYSVTIVATFVDIKVKPCCG